ncbi:MAG: hypothetical protein Q7T55_00140, partial [Solirubrobacteraceae bacterium]|nr:hypothetical protein [Solirubrobacteraceae bacterium]
AVSQVEACYTDTQTMATCTTAPELGNTGLSIGNGVDQVLITAVGADGFTIVAKSKTNNTFTITKDGTTGTISRTCQKPTGAKDGACKTDGAVW